jgi:hypothetical protein
VIARFIRNLAGFLFCLLVVDSGLVVLNGAMMIANYLACKGSFELLGFEMRPLWTDELVGHLLGAFFPKATLAHFYALIVAVTVALGLFLVFKLAFSVADLWEARRDSLAANDQESARKAMRLIVRDLGMLLIFLIPLAWAIYWDVYLFRYRSIAGALGIEDPTVAPQMFGWERQLRENGELFAWALVHIGAWGYVAVTALACLSLEFAWHKTVRYWDWLEGNCRELMQPATTPQEQALFYGYDHNGQPVYDPNVPIAYDTDGNPVAGQDETGADTSPGTAAHEANTGSQSEPTSSAATATNGNGAVDASLFDPAPANQDGATPNGAADKTSSGFRPTHRTRAERAPAGVSTASRTADNDLHPVIGGTEGERVSLAAALADRRRYWVDPETHDVWDTDFRQALLNGGAPQATA